MYSVDVFDLYRLLSILFGGGECGEMCMFALVFLLPCIYVLSSLSVSDVIYQVQL